MRQLVGLLALGWALANLATAYLFVSSGLRLTNKGVLDQVLLVLGGALIGLFALLLVVTAARLVVSRSASTLPAG